MNKEQESDFHGVNYYVIIPERVLHDNRLTPLARLIYGELAALANINGFAWISNQKIANKYDVSLATIKRSLSLLKDFGYIKTEVFYKENSKEVERRNIYIEGGFDNNTTLGSKIIPPSVQKQTEPRFINELENNTINNTINKDMDIDIDSKSISDIYGFYQQNFGVISSSKFEQLKELYNESNPVLLKEALKSADNYNAKSPIDYARSILDGWARANVQTLDDVEALRVQREKEMQSKSQGYGKQQRVVKPIPEWASANKGNEYQPEAVQPEKLMSMFNTMLEHSGDQPASIEEVTAFMSGDASGYSLGAFYKWRESQN